MNHLFLKTSSLVLLFILLFTSCNKLDFNKVAKGAWNPNLAVPIAQANFTVYEILASSDSTDLVVIDQSSGAIALVYKGEIFSIDAETLVNIEDLNESANLDFTELNAVPTPSFSGSVNSSNNQNFTFDAGIAELHQVEFKSGSLEINVSANIAHNVTCVLTFPDLKKNGNPVSTTVTLNYTGNTPQTATASVSLVGAIGDFTLGNTTFNQLNAIISTTINGSGQAITGSEDLNFEFGFNNMNFKNASGYFGQNDLGISGDSVLMKLFQNSTSGFFALVNPKIKFLAENSFGFPIRVNLNELKSVNVNSGNEFPLSGYPSFFDISRATVMGQSANSQLELNTTNTTNLSTLVTSVPKYFIYNADVQSNPNGNISPLNFITDESILKIRTEVELPLEGSAYGFELKDTFDFNFNEDVSQLESVMFRLNIDNGFPIELKSQVVFLDQNYNPVFTVFNTPESVVSPALVDINGRVNKRIKKITDIHLSELQIALLPEVKYILINAISQTLNGPSGEVVKLFDDYTLDLKLGLQVQGKISF